MPRASNGVEGRSGRPVRSYTATEVFAAVTMAASPMAPVGSAGQFGPILGIASKCRDDTGALGPFAAAMPDEPIGTATSATIATQTPARRADLLTVQPSPERGPWTWSVNLSETGPGFHEPHCRRSR